MRSEMPPSACLQAFTHLSYLVLQAPDKTYIVPEMYIKSISCILIFFLFPSQIAKYV